MKTELLVKQSFPAFHHYPEAPDDVAFLRNLHRHVFTIILHIPVRHHNRDLEFFQIQRKLREFLLDHYDEQDLGAMSCEDIAQSIADEMVDFSLVCSMVECWEDMENGAIVYLEMPNAS